MEDYHVGKDQHISIWYFFITDRIKNKEFKVEYCPTGEMIADFFTKPLQGKLFRKFRNLILGVKEEDFDEYKTKYEETLKVFGRVRGENSSYRM